MVDSQGKVSVVRIVLIVSLTFVCTFLTGAIYGRQRSDEKYESVLAERDAEYRQYRDLMERFRDSVEVDRGRIVVLGESLEGAIGRAGEIRSSAERVVVLVGALRTVAEGIRGIYAQSPAILHEAVGRGQEDDSGAGGPH